MAVEADPGVVREAIGWIVSAVFGVVTWLFSRVTRKHDEEIGEAKRLAEAALPRRDWEAAREEAQHERDNIRSDVKELYGKHDSMKDYINGRMDSVEAKIMARVDSLARDMNGGLSGIREELRHMNRPPRL